MGRQLEKKNDTSFETPVDLAMATNDTVELIEICVTVDKLGYYCQVCPKKPLKTKKSRMIDHFETEHTEVNLDLLKKHLESLEVQRDKLFLQEQVIDKEKEINEMGRLKEYIIVDDCSFQCQLCPNR